MDINEVNEAAAELEAEGLIEIIPEPAVELTVVRKVDVKIDARIDFSDGGYLKAQALKTGMKMSYAKRVKRSRYPYNSTTEESSALTVPYDKVPFVLELL